MKQTAIFTQQLETDGDIHYTTNLVESLKDTKRTVGLMDRAFKDMFHHIETDSNIHSTTNTVIEIDRDIHYTTNTVID
ncbi:hypothetical protein AGMMS50229_05940 [Campylobacterota bacterium]|nr:hypothetical protein AGMMS50229_05940 [Campylobacterota bacterium]